MSQSAQNGIELNVTSSPRSVGSLVLTDVRVEDVPGVALRVWSTPPAGRSLLHLEQLSVNHTGYNSSTGPAVDLRLRNTDLLMRNCLFSHVTAVDSAVFSLLLHSDGTATTSTAKFTQNSFVSCTGDGVIAANNTGDATASLTMTKNSLRHNSVNDTGSVVQLVNMAVVMEDNLFYNNSGRHLLEIGVAAQCNRLPVRAHRNVFWSNTALKGAVTCTVSLNASDVTFTANVFNNPANEYEVSAEETGATRTGELRVDFAHNWWGSDSPHVVANRLRDGTTVEGLPVVVSTPFETTPPEGMHFSSENALSSVLRV